MIKTKNFGAAHLYQSAAPLCDFAVQKSRAELAFAGADQVKRSFAGGMYTAGNDSHPADI